MWTILWPIMLFLSVVVWPMWLWRRMKRVQRAARDALDDTPARNDMWEESSVADDGLRYGRAQGFDPMLAKASRDAAGADDMKNLEGGRRPLPDGFRDRLAKIRCPAKGGSVSLIAAPYR